MRAFKQSRTMKRLYTTVAIFLLSGGLALAQAGGGGAGPSGPSTGSSTTGPTNPNGPSLPPSPSGGTTVGQAGVNPGNSQDLTNRNNPQDLTRPGGSNPQDLKR
jgi:hypothetical protein